MGNYRVCVYAICKNEQAFVQRWMDGMAEADSIVVLDTGSTDDTVRQLRERGAKVSVESIDPWRFDVARNRALELVAPDVDICVCTDLDEVFVPGWRAQLERAWGPDVGQATYRYTWSFNPDGSEGVVFRGEKIHARQGYRWIHPVHEVLTWVGEGARGRVAITQGVQLNHYPDPEKSRGQYLPLLELAVAEEPEDDRNMHYLGREYLYRSRWDECIATLERHLAMPRATWWDERAASMRYIAQAYWNKGELPRARDWYLRAVAEAPHLREPYMDLAMLLYRQENWDGVLYATGCALEIAVRPESYICEAASWGSLPHDLRALAFAHTGHHGQALEQARRALEVEPGNQRLQENVKILNAQVERDENTIKT